MLLSNWRSRDALGHCRRAMATTAIRTQGVPSAAAADRARPYSHRSLDASGKEQELDFRKKKGK